MRQIAIGLGALLLAGCSGAQVRDVPTGDTLAAVRSAIVARNFGDAANSARSLVARQPTDGATNFELARAEALLGNQGAALDALETAVTAGLANVPTALADPAFSSLRDNDRFVALADRANPGSATEPAGEHLAAGNGADRVEITTRNGRNIVRAGDVELNTDF